MEINRESSQRAVCVSSDPQQADSASNFSADKQLS